MVAVSELALLDAAAVAAARGTRSDAVAAVEELDWLGSSIDDDRASGRFSLWGRSSAIDENTRSATVPRALFEVLHERAGLSATWPVGNAGVLHCYGYLLSLEPTPYGLKRQRWLGPELAASCGLPADAFLPWRAGPSLLARATTAASALLDGPTTRTRTVDGRATRMALSAASGPTALAYAVAADAASAPLFVTMFPVADAAAAITDFNSTARLRWNAV